MTVWIALSVYVVAELVQHYARKAIRRYRNKNAVNAVSEGVRQAVISALQANCDRPVDKQQF